jgi:hypothetical protein
MHNEAMYALGIFALLGLYLLGLLLPPVPAYVIAITFAVGVPSLTAAISFVTRPDK